MPPPPVFPPPGIKFTPPDLSKFTLPLPPGIVFTPPGLPKLPKLPFENGKGSGDGGGIGIGFGEGDGSGGIGFGLGEGGGGKGKGKGKGKGRNPFLEVLFDLLKRLGLMASGGRMNPRGKRIFGKMMKGGNNMATLAKLFGSPNLRMQDDNGGMMSIVKKMIIKAMGKEGSGMEELLQDKQAELSGSGSGSGSTKLPRGEASAGTTTDGILIVDDEEFAEDKKMAKGDFEDALKNRVAEEEEEFRVVQPGKNAFINDEETYDDESFLDSNAESKTEEPSYANINLIKGLGSQEKDSDELNVADEVTEADGDDVKEKKSVLDSSNASKDTTNDAIVLPIESSTVKSRMVKTKEGNKSKEVPKKELVKVGSQLKEGKDAKKHGDDDDDSSGDNLMRGVGVMERFNEKKKPIF